MIRADRTSVPPDHQHGAGRDEPRPAGDPARQPEDRRRRGVHRRRRAGAGISRLVKAPAPLAIDARKNLDSLTHPDRPVQAGAGHADRHSGLDSGVGRAPGRHHRGSCRTTTRRRGPSCSKAAPPSRRGRAAVRPAAAHAADRAGQPGQCRPGGGRPTSRASSSCWCCCRRRWPTIQAIGVPNRNTKQDYKGVFLSFNLKLNLPPPCTTGFLPAQQQRVPSCEDYPDRPAGDLYCRVPQDSPVERARCPQHPVRDRPGKRAPTVKMCESDESYVPLNDGYNWKGDPNATLSGQPVPQLPPAPTPQPGARRRRRR